MSQSAVLVTWREINGTEPTAAMLEERLASFRLADVLLGIARLSALLRTWQNEPDYAVDRILSERYLPTYYGRIRYIVDRGPNRLTFSRLGLLFVAKQACRVCGIEGRAIENDQNVEQVFSCCLLANDLLLGRVPAPTDSSIDKASSLLTFSNYVPRNSYPIDLARSLLLMEEIGPQLTARTDYVDLAATFKRATGISARDFCQLAFAASVKFITNVETQLNDPNTAFLLTPRYFQHTKVELDDITTFLSRLSTTPAVLHERAQRDGLGADFLDFQSRPLVEYTTGTYLCVDPGFLLDKAGVSLYWTLHEATQRQGNLLAYWCSVIERYAQWLFEQTYQWNGTCLPGPRFTNGDEVCDLYLVEGSSLLLFETKASTLTVGAKYGFASEVLLDELNLKAINGEEGERKGVAQLFHNIERFLDGDEIPGVDRAAIRRIYPVLVFLDHSFTAPYLNRVYNEQFCGAYLRKKYRRAITPIFSLTVECLENFLPHTHKHAFTDILDSYNSANKGMHGAPSRSKVPILQREPPGKDPVRERFHRFTRDLELRLFPSAPLERSPDATATS